MTEVLLATWITVYIYVFYPYEDVKIPTMAVEGGVHYRDTRVSKANYFVRMALPWYITSVIFLYGFITAMYWVRLNENYPKSN